jgi:phosphate transport system substrate-binding protein
MLAARGVIIRTILALACLLALPLAGRAEIIKIAGSGQMLPLASDLALEYEKKYPADRVLVNPNSLGQKGGIQALVEGVVDIATSARRLDDTEMSLPVKAYEVASVAGLFAVHPSVTVRNLSYAQIYGIYAGKIKNWQEVGGPDAPIVVFTRPEEDSTKIVMRRRLPGFAKLKEAPEVIVKQKSRDQIYALTHTPFSIGMTDAINLTKANGKIVAIKLNGKDVSSSVTGPIQHYYNFVLRMNARPIDYRFIDFVYSPAGQAVIERNMANPLNGKP